MAAQPVKVYALKNVYLRDVPHVDHETETKAEAEALVATGAFTDNPRHPDRLHVDDPPPLAAKPTHRDPPEGGSSDSEA